MGGLAGVHCRGRLLRGVGRVESRIDLPAAAAPASLGAAAAAAASIAARGLPDFAATAATLATGRLFASHSSAPLTSPATPFPASLAATIAVAAVAAATAAAAPNLTGVPAVVRL